jgi:hypothetical protein
MIQWILSNSFSCYCELPTAMMFELKRCSAGINFENLKRNFWEIIDQIVIINMGFLDDRRVQATWAAMYGQAAQIQKPLATHGFES